jgi:hypothetical protein
VKLYQAQVIISDGFGGQGAAPAPFLKDVRLDLFPSHQRARLVLQFKDAARLQTKLAMKLARNFDLAVLGQDRFHSIKLRAGRGLSRRESWAYRCFFSFAVPISFCVFRGSKGLLRIQFSPGTPA